MGSYECERYNRSHKTYIPTHKKKHYSSLLGKCHPVCFNHDYDCSDCNNVIDILMEKETGLEINDVYKYSVLL